MPGRDSSLGLGLDIYGQILQEEGAQPSRSSGSEVREYAYCTLASIHTTVEY